jgi:hypothetical protein
MLGDESRSRLQPRQTFDHANYIFVSIGRASFLLEVRIFVTTVENGLPATGSRRLRRLKKVGWNVVLSLPRGIVNDGSAGPNRPGILLTACGSQLEGHSWPLSHWYRSDIPYRSSHLWSSFWSDMLQLNRSDPRRHFGDCRGSQSLPISTVSMRSRPPRAGAL